MVTYWHKNYMVWEDDSVVFEHNYQTGRSMVHGYTREGQYRSAVISYTSTMPLPKFWSVAW